MHRARLSVLLCGCVSLALAGCGGSASDATRTVRRMTANMTAAPEIPQLLSGELIAERSVEITVPDVGLRPLEIRWMAENGAVVAEGEPLFELDNSDLASRLDASRVTVLEARSRISTTESEASTKVSDAALELERRRAELAKARIDAAVPRELRSKEEYQRLQLELQKAQRRVADAERLLSTARSTARADVEKQRLQLGKEEAVLRQVEGGIRRLAVTAPIAGVVLIDRSWEQDRPFEVGDLVYPGNRLAELPDLTTLVARARLFDVDDGRVARGMRATIELDAHPGLEFGGWVRSVDRIAFQRDRDSSARVFWVTIDLERLDPERMRAGMSIKASIERSPADGGERTLVAPRESLDLTDPTVPKALLADGSWKVIKIGACAPLECVVTEGLVEGDVLGRVNTRSSEGS